MYMRMCELFDNSEYLSLLNGLSSKYNILDIYVSVALTLYISVSCVCVCVHVHVCVCMKSALFWHKIWLINIFQKIFIHIYVGQEYIYMHILIKQMYVYLHMHTYTAHTYKHIHT